MPARPTARTSPCRDPDGGGSGPERERYPDIRPAGGPVFGTAEERQGDGWLLHPHLTGAAPREARDLLGARLRLLALGAHATGGRERRDACLRAAERLEREPVDTVTAAGVRYRVVRAERFWRTGPDGPEPPRPSDPGTGRARLEHDPAGGFVIGRSVAGGVSDGISALELLAVLPRPGTVPERVRRDASRAARLHPGGVLLPASFMTVERSGGCWVAHDSGTSFTPQGARAGLAAHLRVIAPWQLRLGPADRAAYAAAADRLDAERPGELTVCGRHFRIVRVERLMRVGPCGPETPRPSDPDPPPAGDTTDPADGPAPEPDEAARRFQELFRAERLRQDALHRSRPPRG